MKTRYYICALLAAGQLVASAPGQTWAVREYGGAPCGCFTTDPVFKTIRVTSNPSRTLKFEVFHDVAGFPPGDINDFSIDPTVTGSMVIEIAGDAAQGRIWGAASIAKLNFVRNDPNNNTTRVTKFRISGDLGGALPSQTVDFDLIDGSLLVFQDLRNSVTIFGITIGRDLLGTLTIETNTNWPIFVEEELSGTLNVQGDLTSLLRVGDLDEPGSGDLTGTVTIAENVEAGPGENVGQIEVLNQFSGTIDIAGDVIDGENHIWIHHMNGGAISCRNMDLRSPNGGQWLTLGAFAFDETLVQSGTIDVTGTLTGRIYCRTISDLDITIGTLNAGDDNGNGGLAGIMSGVGWLPTSSITVTGDFVRGAIHYVDRGPASTRNLDCDITIMGDMGSATTTARISSVACSGDPNCLPLNLDIGGVIHIGGDLYGAISGDGPAIFAEGNLTGQVRIDGSLFDGLGGDEIVIGGSPFGAQGAVVVDYNGYDKIDVWGAGATVKVGSAPAYTGNTPSAKVWESSSVLGDMNNDGALNGGDIDPFFLGLGDPAGYEAAFPGLAGNMEWHGDCNCDGGFNGGDIDPFFALLGGGPSCRGFNFMTPENIAWLIETNVRPDRLERAILLVAEYVNVWARGERRTFWMQVLELLRPS